MFADNLAVPLINQIGFALIGDQKTSTQLAIHHGNAVKFETLKTNNPLINQGVIANRVYSIGICALTGTRMPMLRRFCLSLFDWDMRSDRNWTTWCPTTTLSLFDWDMRSDRNAHTRAKHVGVSLFDWDMRSDRNTPTLRWCAPLSLFDWDMRSDRNSGMLGPYSLRSLFDWDMRSDRNLLQARQKLAISLFDWDMRSDRNQTTKQAPQTLKSIRLGYAL